MKSLSRRNVLGAFGGLGALWLFGCDGSSSAGTEDGGSSSGTDGGTSSSDGSVLSGGLAVGSGAFLTGKDYGNPFGSGIGSSCVAFGSATKGPCHSNTYLRKDLSDGLVGLPTRFELMVVDTSCKPVPNAIVEIWYASPAGTYSRAAQAIDSGTGYSGSLSDLNTSFCTGNDAAALASNWLRGFQMTGTDGRTTIDGIFPGWYAGRTTHIHFIITANGKTYVTSQLLFDETLTTEVYTKHSSYSSRGNKDTLNANDNIVRGGLSLSSSVMSFAKQSDGAVVTWKAITIA
ncbi:MAG: protocatechuate 3,4-dioxygenase [Myxococcales bacterium]|nr:protocatechuate 3,4-dioxygenase [Myxococcales bacterium]